jgi:hypothetical protein
VLALVDEGVSAQGKKEKPPQKYFGTAVFRCPNTGTSTDCAGDDRIYADQASNDAAFSGLGWPGAGLFSGNQEMHIGLDVGGVNYYSVGLNIGAPEAQPPCVSAGSCRFPHTGIPITLTDAEIQSNVVDSVGNEIPGGLFSLQTNGPAGQARFRITFIHPGTGQTFHLNFSVAQYSGANHARVTRIASCTWVFEAQDELAGLWTFGTIGGRGKSVRIDEGLYKMPMKVTFKAYDAPGCPAKA